MNWDLVLIVIEIGLAVALLIMFQAARRALSFDEARRAAAEEAEGLAESVEMLTRRIEEATDRALADLGRSIEQAEQLVGKLEAAADTARPFVVVEAEGAGEESRAPQRKVKQLRVLELAESGLEPGAIARELDIGIGEVQLMLGLSRRTGAAPSGGLFATPDGEPSE